MGKAVISRFRAETASILIYEFANNPIFFKVIGSDACRIVSRLLKVNPETVDRYVRACGFRPKYNLIMPEITDTTLVEHRDKLNNKTRAIMVLRINKYNWKDIGKVFKENPKSVKRYYYRKLATLKI